MPACCCRRTSTQRFCQFLGRLQRAGTIEADDVGTKLHDLAAAPILRHPVAGRLIGAWARHDQLRRADTWYVELAMSRGLPLITTDRRLHPVPVVGIMVE